LVPNGIPSFRHSNPAKQKEMEAKFAEEAKKFKDMEIDKDLAKDMKGRRNVFNVRIEGDTLIMWNADDNLGGAFGGFGGDKARLTRVR
jgi:hypothetical protein